MEGAYERRGNDEIHVNKEDKIDGEENTKKDIKYKDKYMKKNVVGKEGKTIKNGIRKYESGPYNYSRHSTSNISKFYNV
jgi:hypothetical protein